MQGTISYYSDGTRRSYVISRFCVLGVVGVVCSDVYFHGSDSVRGPCGQGPHFYVRTLYIVKRSQLQSLVAGRLRPGPLTVVVVCSNDSTTAESNDTIPLYQRGCQVEEINMFLSIEAAASTSPFIIITYIKERVGFVGVCTLRVPLVLLYFTLSQMIHYSSVYITIILCECVLKLFFQY